MNDTLAEELVRELRKQNRLRRISIGVLVALVCVFAFGFAIAGYRMVLYARSSALSTPEWSWDRVRRLMDRSAFPDAEILAQQLLAKSPKYAYGHSMLGHIYQAMGDVEKAEQSFARAVDLFPSEQNEKYLGAIRRVISSAKSTDQVQD